MKKIALSVCVAMVLLANAAFCGDWQDLDDENLRTFQGTVTAVDVKASTISVQATISGVFPISSDTSLIRNGMDITLSDISVGNYVTIDYYHDGSENMRPVKALSVTVEYEDQ